MGSKGVVLKVECNKMRVMKLTRVWFRQALQETPNQDHSGGNERSMLGLQKADPCSHRPLRPWHGCGEGEHRFLIGEVKARMKRT